MALYEAAVANNDGELNLSSEEEPFSSDTLNGCGGSGSSGSVITVSSGHRRDAMLTRARTQERDYKQRVVSGGPVGGGPKSCGSLNEFSIGGGAGGDDATQDSDLEGDPSAARARPASFSARAASFKRPAGSCSLLRRNSGLSNSTASRASTSVSRAECPSERLRFHRDFTQLMRLALPARREKEAATRGHSCEPGPEVGHHTHQPQQQETDLMLVRGCSQGELGHTIYQWRDISNSLIEINVKNTKVVIVAGILLII